MTPGEAAMATNMENAQRAFSSKQEAQLACLREIMALLKEQNTLLRAINDNMRPKNGEGGYAI